MLEEELLLELDLWLVVVLVDEDPPEMTFVVVVVVVVVDEPWAPVELSLANVAVIFLMAVAKSSSSSR